jgi:tetratricopeptide (TPR) repeat protein
LEPAADARIYFALGNIYAESGRWLKAQGAYFEALTRDSENPDYVYNLAVTLDYLNKRALALRYYREAVSLTDGGAPSGFDPASARARIADLEK